MAKRHYTKYAISIDGHLYSAKYLGMGKFSEVYRVGDRAVYYTKDDCTKEVLALFYHGGVPHLPEIIQHDNVQAGRTEFQCYSSPIYRNVKRTDTSAYRLRKSIIGWYESFYQMHQINRIKFEPNFDTMRKFVEYCRVETDLPRSVVKALDTLTEISGNCGYDISFDMHKGNFGVNAYGTLIFRDLVYVVRK
jgi:hypothetical protein